MKVWIDIRTGTWGTNFEEVMIVDLDSSELHDVHTDSHSLLAFLEGASDSEIATFGDRYGKRLDGVDKDDNIDPMIDRSYIYRGIE